MFTRVAPFISFKNSVFAFTSWLTGTRGLAFGLFWLSTKLIVSRFWFKVSDVQIFPFIFHLEDIAGLLIGLISFNIIVTPGTGRTEERERWGMAVGGVVGTHTFIKFTLLYRFGSWWSKTIYNSNIKDCWSQITLTNIITMKTFEILWELLKPDTETWSKQMLLEKWCRKTCWTKDCHKPSISKTTDNCKVQ